MKNVKKKPHGRAQMAGGILVDGDEIRFKCAFCGKTFRTASACAKHIEHESVFNICFPNDIIPVLLKKGEIVAEADVR